MSLDTFKRIAIVGCNHKLKSSQSIQALAKFLIKNQYDIVLEQQTADSAQTTHYPTCQAQDLSQHADIIIVVGGDGSLLHAAQLALRQNLPIIGINRGTLGFLTDIHPNELEVIHPMLQGQYQLEQRFLLEANLQPKHQDQRTVIALNDVVLMPGQIAHMLDFKLSINQQFVCHQRADGLIIATPTGSTAYALSAGGPIVHPGLGAITLVPMLPHKLSSRPLVVDHNSHIEIQVESSKNSAPCISYDGIETIAIEHESLITIKRLPQVLKLLHPIHYDYFHTLRSKLGWEIK